MTTPLEDISKGPDECADMNQEINHSKKRQADEEEGHPLKVSKVEDSGASEIYVSWSSHVWKQFIFNFSGIFFSKEYKLFYKIMMQLNGISIMGYFRMF